MRTKKTKWICLKDRQPKYMADAVVALVDNKTREVMKTYNGFFVPPFHGKPLAFCPLGSGGKYPTHEGGVIPKSYTIDEEDWENLYYFIYDYDELGKQAKP